MNEPQGRECVLSVMLPLSSLDIGFVCGVAALLLIVKLALELTVVWPRWRHSRAAARRQARV